MEELAAGRGEEHWTPRRLQDDEAAGDRDGGAHQELQVHHRHREERRPQPTGST